MAFSGVSLETNFATGPRSSQFESQRWHEEPWTRWRLRAQRMGISSLSVTFPFPASTLSAEKHTWEVGHISNHQADPYEINIVSLQVQRYCAYILSCGFVSQLLTSCRLHNVDNRVDPSQSVPFAPTLYLSQTSEPLKSSHIPCFTSCEYNLDRGQNCFMTSPIKNIDLTTHLKAQRSCPKPLHIWSYSSKKEKSNKNEHRAL